MKFFVTGANGFIGSYLCKYLLEKGHNVIASSRSFLPEMKETLAGAEFIEGDVLSEDFKNLKVDADIVIHLAAGNDRVSKNQAKGIELATVGTVNVMNMAVANGIEKFMFYSTLQVYGGELSGACSEDSPIKSVNDYGMNHYFGELYAEMYSRKHNLKVLSVRPSNIYGPFLSKNINRWTLVPGCFVKEGVEKGTITLLSSGKQTRNFITLEQLSYATEQVAFNMKKPYDVLNFVGHDYKCIHDMAMLTQQAFKNEGMDVEVIVASDEPKVGNDFHFSHSKLLEYSVDFSKVGADPIQNIASVIRLLRS